MTMIADPESLASGLRFTKGVKDIDIVHFPKGKELWVTLGDSIDTDKLRVVADNLGYRAVRVGSFPSKLPRSLAEVIWDGLSYVITKKHHWWKLKPDSQVASIVKDLMTGDMVYHVNDDDGLKILYGYLEN